MHPFRYAQDYYGDAGPQQLRAAVALFLTALVLVFAGIHLLRRSFGEPRTSEPGTPLPANSRALKYEGNARLYHWANVALFLLLGISGVALFAPGSLRAAPWLRTHEFTAAAFIAALVIHAIAAPIRGEGLAMWFSRRDWQDFRTTVASFFGRTGQYPAFGKYDPWQKIYHALLAVICIAVIVSGIVLTASAEVWTTYSHSFLRAMRLTHDLSAAVLLAIIVGHIYFGLIRVNWPQLKAMFTGTISAAAFNRLHRLERWKPRQYGPER